MARSHSRPGTTSRTKVWPVPGVKALIGMVHVRALPGTPRAVLTVDRIVETAAKEARTLQDVGFDAVIVENMHDAPYVHAGVHGSHPPETVAVMTRVLLAVREAAPRLRAGVQVLSGGNREALAIALAGGAGFIRCENFVFAHVADEGLLGRAEAGPLLRYRRGIGAEHIRIFCDLKKKHASHAITADLSLSDAAEGAEFFGADGVIVTGTATGRSADLGDVAEVRAATRLPVMVGSGVTPDTVPELFEHADALIVGSFIKRGGHWLNELDVGRCREIVSAARDARNEL